MNKYFESPNKPETNFREYDKSIFLAGSITRAKNWQIFAKDNLIDKYHIFNPRRINYNISVEGVEKEQITWEFNYLTRCKHILFWFSNETLAPITLLELGTLFDNAKKHWQYVYIGVDPEYKRKNDVIIQTSLRAPNIPIVFNLEELIKLIKK